MSGSRGHCGEIATTRFIPGSVVYGLLVWVGTGILGFLVAPFLGVASGLFAIDADAAAFFSLLTLKAAPTLTALSILSSILHPIFGRRRLRFQAALLAATTLGVWLIGAAVAFATLE